MSSDRFEGDITNLSTSAFSNSTQSNNPLPQSKAASKKRTYTRRQNTTKSTTKATKSKKGGLFDSLILAKKKNRINLYLKRFECCQSLAPYLNKCKDMEDYEQFELLCKEQINTRQIFDSGSSLVFQACAGIEALGNLPIVKENILPGTNINPLDGFGAIVERSYARNQNVRETFDALFVEVSDYLCGSPFFNFGKTMMVLLYATVMANRTKAFVGDVRTHAAANGMNYPPRYDEEKDDQEEENDK